MSWELYQQQGGGRSSVGVALSNRGVLIISKARYAILGSPSHVNLMYDRENRIIGIRPTTDIKPYSREVRQIRDGSYLVRMKPFCNYYEIELENTYRFKDAPIEEGMMLLDLKSASYFMRRDGRRANTKKERIDRNIDSTISQIQ